MSTKNDNKCAGQRVRDFFVGQCRPKCPEHAEELRTSCPEAEAKSHFSRTIRSTVISFNVKTNMFWQKYCTDVYPVLIDAILGPKSDISTKNTRLVVNMSKSKHVGVCLVLFAPKYHFSRTLFAEKGFSHTSEPEIMHTKTKPKVTYTVSQKSQGTTKTHVCPILYARNFQQSSMPLQAQKRFK